MLYKHKFVVNFLGCKMKLNKLNGSINILFELSIFILFFFILEWRWQFELLFGKIPNPYYLISFLSFFYIVFRLFSIITLKEKISVIYLVVLSSVIYCAMAFVINIPEIIVINSKIIYTHIGIWLINISLFMIASDKYFWKKILSSNFIIILYLLLLVTPILLMIYLGQYIESGFSLNNQVAIMGLWNENNHGVVYQSYGDKIVLLTILMSELRPKYVFIFTYLALFSLFVVGSKASMVAFVLVIIIYYIIRLCFKKRYIKLIFISFFSLTGLFVLKIILNTWNMLLYYPNNWLLLLIYKKSEDVSFLTRKNIMIENMKTFTSRLLLGDYLFDLKLGRMGTYTHNVLAFIEYYGVIIFIFYVLIWFYIMYILFYVLKNNNIFVKHTFYSMIFMTILFVGARNGMDYLTYWVLGMSILALDLIKSNYDLN